MRLHHSCCLKANKRENKHSVNTGTPLAPYQGAHLYTFGLFTSQDGSWLQEWTMKMAAVLCLQRSI